MSAWTIIAVLSCLCLMPLMWALAPRAKSGEISAALADNVHYRAQLEEIDRLRVSGAIAERDADGARIEAARRLIGSKASAGKELTGPSLRRLTLILSLILLIAVPSIAVTVYARLGQPTLEDVPLAARRAEDPAVYRALDMLTDLESRISVNPDDGEAHATLAAIYMRLGRFGDAAKSYKSASRVLGPTPPLLVGQAEAIVSSSNGQVVPEARGLFAKALEQDPSNGAARFYGAMAMKQDGRKADAAAIWQSLWTDTPEPELRKVIEAELASIGSAPPAKVPQP